MRKWNENKTPVKTQKHIMGKKVRERKEFIVDNSGYY